jgi:menaquinone-dependent protoporphyrinogen oxidase
MNILIAVASRHGSTRMIADAIAQELTSSGKTVTVQDVAKVTNLEFHAAAIVGSAIYFGNWLPEARQFVQRNGNTLSAMNVWLFSSGPLGEGNPQPKDDPGHLADLMRACGAREHRTFIGKLDRNDLGFGERLAVKMVKAPEGDFRDWEAIREWAQGIASALAASAQAGSSFKGGTIDVNTTVPGTAHS